jgi:hypothetical protein
MEATARDLSEMEQDVDETDETMDMDEQPQVLLLPEYNSCTSRLTPT